MRFKAEISNPPQFSRLITSLAPLSKIATLKLKEDAVHFICMGDGTKSGIQVWRCGDFVDTPARLAVEADLLMSHCSDTAKSTMSVLLSPCQCLH